MEKPKAKLVKTEQGCYELYQGNEMLGSTYPYQNINSLSEKNCQAIERGYDLDELARIYANDDVDLSNEFGKGHREGCYMGFLEGAKAILELMGDKKFTENDVRKAINESRFCSVTDEYGSIRFHYEDDKIIQSLQQNEWEVEIVEFTADDLKSVSDDWNKLGKPKFDSDGCLILKRV